ncbi:uncharacterized protein MYCFIDRAFT_172155 [Pseudocercospora fijiensis CIRAD86]|uniref:Uncharacterized protein n=1 Tax=Pseudocercospora fijiensis (strain CIRAD86) TaxID=383855 RepID=M3AP71_PSEFD|nr:uncharacterized protein MYCFIDRAFT_172155 [Pseudocercospora fijiensis CIRAD86]EME86396.1 hypothetical protein MYCFIDRAFT_172155 [Pseudocercospora fijiensis CIRAD86]
MCQIAEYYSDRELHHDYPGPNEPIEQACSKRRGACVGTVYLGIKHANYSRA